MTEHESKRAMRAEMKAKLGKLPDTVRADASAQACARLLATVWGESSRTAMLYVPMPGELDIGPAIQAFLERGVRVCIPRPDWSTRQMEPAAIRRYPGDIVLDSRGIPQPVDGCRAVPLEDVDLIVTPGLAFDRRGGRLGRGGGFYDRLLSRPDMRAAVVGVGFEEQFVDSVPMRNIGLEPDALLDAIITERRLVLGAERDGD